MMTGRVLLVCALCVLWCCVVVPAAYGLVSDRGVVEEDMVLTWYPEAEMDCEEKNTKEGMLDVLGFKMCMHESMNEICGNGDETPSKCRGPKAEEICKKYAGDPNKAVDSSTQLPEALPDAEKQVAAATPETPKGGAAEMGSTPEPQRVIHQQTQRKGRNQPQLPPILQITRLKKAVKWRCRGMHRNPIMQGKKKEKKVKRSTVIRKTPAKAERMKNITTTAEPWLSRPPQRGARV
ncbi:mucin-associated surface protein (MASP), putative [Trypanosoma cruzi]|uniref:Mucin-associated surface protein (MASP), putative n=1 Tax=Trypanosoma cruzi (strain CL Brener) TaxID=353153 RepID=Q4DNG6_TRYCC|nr:mucin-associated surface protein (MASP), putative [Trypanosoma cruzi]EAN94065.1 mucin-associated surface protein (MASP), putative [Trypanosoma cruzi]|eukprot:XP_815916.1 mucin-associated surface protein (MASP) [Trypanosoma cruzi strain CL Brener]